MHFVNFAYKIYSNMYCGVRSNKSYLNICTTILYINFFHRNHLVCVYSKHCHVVYISYNYISQWETKKLFCHEFGVIFCEILFVCSFCSQSYVCNSLRDLEFEYFSLVLSKKMLLCKKKKKLLRN